MGQNKRMFLTRIEEKINSVKKTGNTSKYNQHILEKRHVYETAQNTTSILHTIKELKNIIKNFHIYKFSEEKNKA